MNLDDQSRERPFTHGRVALACAVFVGSMTAMSFAAVPLYRIFCEATGFGGATMRASAAPARSLDQTIEVRFDANVNSGLPWRFRPLQRTVRARLGAETKVIYEVENLSDAPATGSATFNVMPPQAGAFFNKIDCFCFTEQTLQPGERQEMPVVFFVDPALAADPDAKNIPSIVLSYTFFATPNKP